MANGNGNTYKIIIGVIVFALTLLGSAMGLYSTFHVPLRNAIAEEVKERSDEDKEIRKNYTDTQRELMATLSDIRAQIARIETKVERIP